MTNKNKTIEDLENVSMLDDNAEIASIKADVKFMLNREAKNTEGLNAKKIIDVIYSVDKVIQFLIKERSKLEAKDNYDFIHINNLCNFYMDLCKFLNHLYFKNIKIEE